MSRLSERTRRAAIAASLSAALIASVAPAVRADTGGDASRASFIVMFREQADLSSAANAPTRDARRLTVVQQSRATAERTQDAVRALLEQARQAGRVGAITPLWIVNAVAFEGETSIANTIRERPEVDRVETDSTIPMDPARSAIVEPRLGTVEWNVAKIRAPEVWASGISGQDVVIGAIDTGGDYLHTAIASQYRGRLPSGSFDHRSSWYDAVEGSPTPVDPYGHGTSVLGIALGGDGPGPDLNDIGVAYGARWIAARAFDRNGQSMLSRILLASEWMLAPTGSDGRPDVSLAPDIVNGSWAAEGCAPWFRALAATFLAADVFPVFAVGNVGDPRMPRSSLVGSPADARESFAVTATDSSDEVPSFARRGPSCFPDATGDFAKPDVAAPGVNIRTAAPGGGYAARTGTSFSSPHAAGTVALMLDGARRTGHAWSTTDIRLAVRRSAVDLYQLYCDDRSGCGRLDAKAAVQIVTTGGTIAGLVKDAVGGAPIPGASVSASGDDPRESGSSTSAADGSYAIRGLFGTYYVHASAFGYRETTVQAAALPGQTTVMDFALQPIPRGAVEGRITNAVTGEPVEGAAVRISSSTLRATTAADGTYRFADVPEGAYVLTAAADACSLPGERPISVSGGGTVSVDIALAVRRDAAGYWCGAASRRWVPGTRALDLAGDDEWTALPLPFAFPVYDTVADTAFVSTNGMVRFASGSAEWENEPLPSGAEPNLAVYPLWDDLWIDGRAQVLIAETADQVAIEWRDAAFVYSPDDRVTFEVILHRGGDLEMQYATPGSDSARGGSATVGIEGPGGTTGIEYLFNRAVLPSGAGLVFTRLADAGVLAGTVADAATGSPISGAAVAVSSGPDARSTTSGPGGEFRMLLAPGAWSLAASAFGYAPFGEPGVLVASAGTTSRAVALGAVPRYPLAGTVTEEGSGAPLAGIAVSVEGTGLQGSTGGSGGYAFSLPAGAYHITAAPTGRCQTTASADVVLGAGGATQDFAIGLRSDDFGYACLEQTGAGGSWIDGTDRLDLSGDDAAASIELPFGFLFYGQSRTAAHISTNGFVRFDEASMEFENGALPSQAAPNLAVYAFWDDLLVDSQAGIYTRALTDAFVIEWRNVVARAPHETTRVTFEAILHPEGTFDLIYRSGAGARARGAEATTGVEGPDGAGALAYSVNESALEPGLRVTYYPGAHPVTGVVTDAATGAVIPGAVVSAHGSGGALAASATTDAAGTYRLLLTPGTYAIGGIAFGYGESVVGGVVVGGATGLDLQLTALPRYELSGFVTDAASGRALGGAIVSLDAPGVAPVVTGTDGSYRFLLPEGTYVITTSGRCRGGASTTATVGTSGARADLALPTLADASYRCEDAAPMQWTPGEIVLPLSGDDASMLVPLPWDFPLYGQSSRLAWITTNGVVRFDGPGAAPPDASSTIPSPAAPKLALDPYWADLVMDGLSHIVVALPSPDVLVVEWQNMIVKSTGERATFEAILVRTGAVDFQYQSVPASPAYPVRVGIESGDGVRGLTYPQAPRSGQRLRFVPGP